jgi:site-specific DNA-methyltransferase (cytosine-N4-specific)
MRTIRADARSTGLPDNSVDLVLWSPPYFAMRIYGEDAEREIGRPQNVNDYVCQLLDSVREGFRVLRPGRAMFVNVQDRYVNRARVRASAHQPSLNPVRKFAGSWAEAAAEGKVLTGRIAGLPERGLALVPERFAVACADAGFFVKSHIVWAKPFGVPDPSAYDRPAIRHESIYMLSETPDVWANFDTPGTLGSVWTVNPSNARNGHPAPWPSALVKPIIEHWSAPGETVLDQFGGSGTTAKQAILMGRNGISVDIYDWDIAS